MAYERTWAFSYNNTYTPTSNADQTKYQMWALKAFLLGQFGGLTLGLWTTYSSCDGSGNFGNGDLIDRWGATYDASKIVNGAATNPHSWYVLKSPTMNGNTFYMLVSPDSTAAINGTLQMAKSPFASGTNTANPTSADSWNIDSVQSAWNAGASSGILNRFNIALSSVGDFIYFPVQVGQAQPGISSLGIAVIAPVGCHPTDAYPIWTYKQYLPSSPGAFGLSAFGTTLLTRNAAGLSSNANIIGNNVSNAPVGSVDVLSGSYMIMPCRVIVNASNNTWHMRGRLPDLRCVSNSSNGNFPSTGISLRDLSRNVTHVSVGCLWVPSGSDIPNFT